MANMKLLICHERIKHLLVPAHPLLLSPHLVRKNAENAKLKQTTLNFTYGFRANETQQGQTVPSRSKQVARNYNACSQKREALRKTYC